jgi:hemoglobin
MQTFSRPFWAAGAALALAACAGARPAAPPPQSQGSLYDRLGGLPAITAVVDQFMANVAADERVNARFAAENLPDLRQKLIDLVCQVSGGPCTYKGRDMKTVHHGMNLRDSDFDAVGQDMQASLDKFSVPAREKGELLAIVGSLRPQIVNNGAAAQ